MVELFLTLAVLMIILGLMMNLANRVRRELAEKLTRQVLTQLTQQMNEYNKTYNALPPVTEISPPPEPISDETQLQLQARQNNADFVRYLNLTALAKSGKTTDDPLSECFGRSTAGLLEDPWGSPIVFMPTQNSRIGMAPHEFFFSAGPDGKFLTREDNVYSYEGEK